MGISFTAQERLDITRSQLQIVKQNAAYATTTAGLTANQTQILNNDNANTTFYSFYDTQVRSYELEAEAINGTQSAEYTNGVISPFSAGDLSSSAQAPGSAAATFFPSSYTNYVPKIVNSVNGYANPTGTDIVYEQNIISGLQQAITYLLGTPGSASQATLTSIPSGSIAGLVVAVSSVTGFSVGDLVSIVNGSNTSLFEITATNSLGGTLTLSSVIPAQVTLAGGTVSNSTSAMEAVILANVSLWVSKLSTQITQLTSQNDTRSTQSSQNSTALSNANSTKSTLNSWIGSPSYSSGGLAPVSSEITARQTYTPTRVTQIVTALGNVSQSGETISGDSTSSYYNRYAWLNIRINRASGSARKYFDADAGISLLGVLSANNTNTGNQYAMYFLTKSITFIDTTPIIHVTDVTGLSVGDQLTVVSETQPEILRAIISIQGTTQLKLDLPIPNTYTLNDQVRLFKT